MLKNAFARFEGVTKARTSIEVTSTGARFSAAVAALAFLFMCTVAARLYGPTVHPDEWGFLINGQSLIGHVEATVPTGSFYPAGYGLVTGLGGLVTGSFWGAYRFSLFANLALALVTAWYGSRVARRYFSSSRYESILIGALILVVPGTLVASMFSWTETASRLAYLVLFAMLIETTQFSNRNRVITLGFIAGVLPALHGRFTLLLPMFIVLFIAWGWKGKISRGVTVQASAAVVIGYFVAYELNSFIKNSVYTTSYDQENRLLTRLFQPNLWTALVRTMVGQSWYLVATSFGLFSIGVVVSVYVMVKQGHWRTAAFDHKKIGYLALLAGTTGIVFTGGLQLLYGNRGDHLIYGRYVEMVSPVLIVVSIHGLSKFSQLALRWWFIASLMVAVVAVAYVVFDGKDGVKLGYLRDNVVFPNIIGIDALRYFVTPGLINFGIAFCFLCLIFWWIAQQRGMLSVVVMVLVFAAGSTMSGERTMLNRTGNLEKLGATVQFMRDSGSSRVGYAKGISNDRDYYYMRLLLHPMQLVILDFAEEIPAEFSCVYGPADQPPSNGEWKVVAEEPTIWRVLFQRVGTPHC